MYNRPGSLACLAFRALTTAILAGGTLLVATGAAQADTPPPLAAGTYCQGAQSSEPATGPTHVVNIMLENESDQSIETSPDATFERGTLDAQCGDFAQSTMHSTTHGSESNYIALTSGLNASVNSGTDAEARFGLSNCTPTTPNQAATTACPYGTGTIPATTPSLYSQVEQQYGTTGWRDYSDSMPTSCDTGNGNLYATDSNGLGYDLYVGRHNPAIFFSGIACGTQNVPSGNWQAGQGALYNDLMSGTMPYYSFIQPNDIENGHDPVSVTGNNGVTTTIAGGTSQIGNIDHYLASLMSLVQQSPQYQNGSLVVVITFDEGEKVGPIAGEDAVGEDCADPAISPLAYSCQINTWIVGRYVSHYTYNSYMNQFGLLGMDERVLGLQPILGHAADSTTPDILDGTAANPNPFNLAPTGPVTVPGVPTAVAATAGNGNAVVSFALPGSSGGSPVTGYTVTSNPGNITATGSASPITVAGLTNQTAYTFTVTAANTAGSSQPSAPSNAVTPTTPSPPGPPTGVAATAGDKSVVLAWTAPAPIAGAPVSDYLLNYRPTGSTAWTTIDTASTSTTATVSGLTDNTGYDFTVSAVNIGGTGMASAISTATPIAPVVTQLLPDPGFEAGNGGWIAFNVGTLMRVTSPVHGGLDALKVTAPSTAPALVGLTQNSVVTNTVAGRSYTASCYVQPTVAKLNIQIRFLEYSQNYASQIHLADNLTTSLPTGVWTLVSATSTAVNSGERMIPQVYSTNETSANGSILYDDCSMTASTPPPVVTVPSPPTGVSAASGNDSASVTFVPGSNGGAAVTGYAVTASPGGIVATGSGSPITVGGLTNGISYTFTVTATNTAGTSGSSAPSSAVTPSSIPGPPTALTATPGDGQVGLSWLPPAVNGGAPITDYVVQYRPTGSSNWFTYNDGVSTNPATTVTDLPDGIGYDFQVMAVNSAGTGAPSSVVNAIPVAAGTVPGAPTSVTAVAGDGQSTVTFAPPASDGGAPITTYTVTSAPGAITASGAGSPIVLTGLIDGTAYSFTVVATNSVGGSAASAPSNTVTPQLVPVLPGAPTMVTAVAGNVSATVSFSAPATGGSAITGYTVTASPGGITATGTASPIAVGGLTTGTSYTFTVTATNGVGTGPSSAASPAVTPATVPAAPTAVSATATSGGVSVGFTAPASNGGAAITSYSVTSNPSAVVATGAGSPIVVTGLSPAVSYTFTVTATNRIGTGLPSAASNAVTTSVQLLPDPGFESGTGGWTAFNIGTITRSTTIVHGGLYSVQVASPSATANLVGLTQNSAVTSTIAGKTYTASCYVFTSAANLNVQLRFLEYTQNWGSNTHLGDTLVNKLTPNTWTLVQVSSVAVNSGERMVPQIYSTNQTSANGTLLYDDCSFTSG
jgi:hypothetical protein